MQSQFGQRAILGRSSRTVPASNRNDRRHKFGICSPPAIMRTSTWPFADEATALVLYLRIRRTKTGQLRAYVRDHRPLGKLDPLAPDVAFPPDRKKE